MTADLAGRPEAEEPAAATAQELDQEPVEQAPERVLVAEWALGGDQEQAALAQDTGQDTERDQARVQPLAGAPGRHPRAHPEMATLVVSAVAPRAAAQAAAWAPNSSARVARVQGAVP